MTDIFALERRTCPVSLSLRAEAGFRLYASRHASTCLEGRRFNGLEDIQAHVRHFADAPRVPASSRHPGMRGR